MWRWLAVFGCAILIVSWTYTAARVRTVPTGTTVVHDDFTYTVQNVTKTRDGSASIYDVALLVQNHAKRVPYVWRDRTAYMVDERGRTYAPVSRYSANLYPGQSVEVHLRFAMPADTKKPSLRFWDTIFIGDLFDGLRYARTAVVLY
ncbi:MAG: hypothetical protein JO193_04845 [Candidatus Eremiobacteraeota bacterium]|nr:hypothetical protein [Candidatus Eremiobacteraeota bacterium]